MQMIQVFLDSRGPSTFLNSEFAIYDTKRAKDFPLNPSFVGFCKEKLPSYFAVDNITVSLIKLFRISSKIKKIIYLFLKILFYKSYF